MRNGRIEIRTEKTGQLVRIPISDKLAQAIEATPTSGLALISAHGLRKAAAARLVDIGLTEAELEQIMGWAPGSNMSRIYTRRRNDETLANRVADKLRTEKRTIYSQPSHKVGNDSGKGQ